MPASVAFPSLGLELDDHKDEHQCQQPQLHHGACCMPSCVQQAVQHIPQQYSWDCGLACVLMVLRALGCNSCDFSHLRRLSQTTSVWTVDLAHLLAHFGASVTFCTITIGINGDYANEWFYMEHLEHDEQRVHQLFSQAGQLGISLQQRSVPLEELTAAIASGRQLAILLVDRRKIDPWQAAVDMAWNYTTGVTSATGYTGHYILLVGYEPPTAAAAAADTGDSAAAQQGALQSSRVCTCSNSSGAASHESSSSISSSCACCCSGLADPTAPATQQQQRLLLLHDKPSMQSAADVSAQAATDGDPAAQGKAATALLATSAARLGYFWVHDPSCESGPMRMPVSVVESARKSFGTDEDILVIDTAMPLGSAAAAQQAVGVACEAVAAAQPSEVAAGADTRMAAPELAEEATAKFSTAASSYSSWLYIMPWLGVQQQPQQQQQEPDNHLHQQHQEQGHSMEEPSEVQQQQRLRQECQQEERQEQQLLQHEQCSAHQDMAPRSSESCMYNCGSSYCSSSSSSSSSSRELGMMQE